MHRVAAGYDAGIQFGESIAWETVAVRVSPDVAAVVGPPLAATGRLVVDPRDGH